MRAGLRGTKAVGSEFCLCRAVQVSGPCRGERSGTAGEGAADRSGARHVVKPAAGRQSGVLGPGGPGRSGRARHLPQPRERLLRPEDEGAGASRPGDGGRPCRHGGTGGVDHRLGRVGQRPHPRSAVQGALHAHLRAVLGRGHREVSRLRHDPGHRPGLRPQAGPGVRREGVRCHRGRAGTPARGDRHREGAGEADHRCLGRAEGRSARSWCSCTATASARRGRCGYSGPTAPMPWR